MKYIYYIRKTFQGAWEIHGAIGTMQYMGFTQKEAIRKYNKLARQKEKKQ